MHIGHYISGVAHTGLIGWVLLGGVFDSDPPPIEVVDVAMISSAEFDALTQGQEAPETATDVALPQPPTETETAPALASEPDQVVEQSVAPVAPLAEPEETPDVTEVTPPAPIVPDDVAEQPPQLPTPEADAAVVVPDASVRPVPRPADRVAPEPVAQPEPDVTIADDLQEATQPDDSPSAVPDEVTEETAPEAASTEIATEPKQTEAVSAAPTRSLRPRIRPSRPSQPTAEASEDAIAAALAEAGAAESAETATAPTGPPLTRGEKDGLRVAVQQCWVVDVGSRAADVTVVLGLSLDRDGKVQGAVRLLNSEGGDETAVQTAFQAARRAVLRCQKGGYDLPVEKYDHWRDVEITFNPENMRSR
ncbi:energy transducer TonB [Shimia sp.]|uniref:energy transducer TonB n=1 Tax=Shimia sp. TaxID=1954381 RepID=UPI003B8DBB82